MSNKSHTSKPGSAWTKLCVILTLTLPVNACVPAGSSEAICDGTLLTRKNHAAALAADGGDLSVLTGDELINQLDAACG